MSIWHRSKSVKSHSATCTYRARVHTKGVTAIWFYNLLNMQIECHIYMLVPNLMNFSKHINWDCATSMCAKGTNLYASHSISIVVLYP